MIRFFTPATKQAVKQTIAQAAPIVERVTHIGASVVTIYTGYTILSQNRRQPAHPQVDQIETRNQDKASFQIGQ